MIVGRWYVQLAAIWPWYLTWCIYITVFNFMLCLSIPFLYFSLIWYRWIRQNGWWYQQLFKNLCLMFVYVCFMFVIWLERGLICGKSLEMWICLWPEFDCPEVTLCGWQDIKIQLLLLLLLKLIENNLSTLNYHSDVNGPNKTLMTSRCWSSLILEQRQLNTVMLLSSFILSSATSKSPAIDGKHTNKVS